MHRGNSAAPPEPNAVRDAPRHNSAARRDFPRCANRFLCYFSPVGTTKKVTRRQPAKAKLPKVKLAKKPAPEPDEFSAAGGMPNLPALPRGELGREHKALRELGWGEFDRHVQSLAREVSRTFKPDFVIGLVHGGVFVGGALASALKAEFIPLRVSRRSRDAGEARAVEELPPELSGRRVLVVDDVAASGDSIVFASKLARALKVKAVKTAALIARPGRFEPDYVAVSSDEFFVFPWDYQDVVTDRRFDTGEVPVQRASKSAARAR